MIKTILIIVISVTLFGWFFFIIVRNLLKSKLDQLLRDEKNSVMNKFITNVESRIYATLSKQLVENMFGICTQVEIDASTCTVTTSGTATYMGAVMVWSRDDTANTITLQITQPDGTTTEIVVPIKGFGF